MIRSGKKRRRQQERRKTRETRISYYRKQTSEKMVMMKLITVVVRVINPGLSSIKDGTEMCERKEREGQNIRNTLTPHLMSLLYNCHTQQLGTISWGMGA
jgi:translation initiation factor 2B subunit (eIF-2B alpha/beta/delta family)